MQYRVIASRPLKKEGGKKGNSGWVMDGCDGTATLVWFGLVRFSPFRFSPLRFSPLRFNPIQFNPNQVNPIQSRLTSEKEHTYTHTYTRSSSLLSRPLSPFSLSLFSFFLISFFPSHSLPFCLSFPFSLSFFLSFFLFLLVLLSWRGSGCVVFCGVAWCG